MIMPILGHWQSCNAAQLLEFFSLKDSNKWAQVGYLSCFGVVFMFFAWLALAYKRMQKRWWSPTTPHPLPQGWPVPAKALLGLFLLCIWQICSICPQNLLLENFKGLKALVTSSIQLLKFRSDSGKNSDNLQVLRFLRHFDGLNFQIWIQPFEAGMFCIEALCFVPFFPWMSAFWALLEIHQWKNTKSVNGIQASGRSFSLAHQYLCPFVRVRGVKLAAFMIEHAEHASW